jgi:hypothetical protein
MAAIFEAPVAHEAGHEWEWEHPETHEWESHEWEHPEAQEWESHEWESQEWEHPEAHEWEWEHPEAQEWESHESEWEHPEAQEWESHEWESQEWEGEADPFFGKMFKGLARGLGSIAKRVAPFAVRALGSMIPGVGAIAGPMLGQLTQSILKEGEAMAAEAEAEAFGGSHGEAEIGHSEIAHEAALSELLASEAAMANSEAEAVSTVSAALPLTITIMRAGRATRPVMPALTQANARLARAMMRGGGRRGKHLMVTMPTIQRLAVGTIKSAAQSGRPVTPPLAVGAMAAAARRVLGNPRRVEVVANRNLALRRQTAPPPPALVYRPHRHASYYPRRSARTPW